jgi:uncharacterized RDD family membrane protein YckC
MPVGVLAGLCPKCLLAAGLESGAPSEKLASGEPHVGGAQASGGEMPTESYAVSGAKDGKNSSPKRSVLPAPGQTFGHYHLIRQLGQGGMGAVYEADDLASGRRVALKLLAHSLDSTEARNRFFREGRLAASINHPNSVYVYGTDEIDGTPVISMEHVAGQTLQDRLRQQGPLAVTEAVDAVLQIIDGLEAAAAAGVLHRDVKPSNCFIDVDGTVKIGDFGLSISTAVRGDSHLTIPGSFLGTPAFSSPEQLRGDELDVRSDIYAVGVTLFFLLTGRTPFEGENLVQLLATVLEQPPPSPAKFRPEVPRGLANIVLQCLAKQPADRFKSYAELRAALVPYNSTAPTPATLALRLLAGICDRFIWMVPVILVLATMTGAAQLRSPTFVAWTIAVVVFHILYFALPEGLWGASIGKAICRLRVVDRNRDRIGVKRALVRTTIYIVFPNLIAWTYWICGGVPSFESMYKGSSISSWIFMVVGYSYYIMLAVLFSTARRRNGYSGLHDLAVGARVILRTAYRKRPALEVAEPPLPQVDEQNKIGPYHLLDTLDESPAGRFVLGYDTRLLRRVWIRELPLGTPPISTERRNMGRVGRLRWINGCRDAEQAWDVYEALSGKPLLDVVSSPQPWSIVRYWLLDLAEELSLAGKDGTLPKELGLDRVWITGDGRAKLLDFPAPGTNQERWTDAAPTNYQATDAAKFLSHVACAALEGNAHARSAGGPPTMPLPIEARELLTRLPTADNLDDICESLKSAIRQTPEVTRKRRLAMLCATAGFPIFVALFVSAVMYLAGHWQNSEIWQLQQCLVFLDRNVNGRSSGTGDGQTRPSPEAEHEALETYIAGRFRQTVTDTKTWNSFWARTIPTEHRTMAERIVAERSEPSEAELAAAAATLEPILKRINEFNDETGKISPVVIGLAQFVGCWLVFVAIPGVVAAIGSGRGLVMQLFGVRCVTRTGRRASRLRMLWRTIVFNAPVLMGPIVLALVVPLVQRVAPSLIAIVLVLVALVVWSLLLPTRGLADRLAGTFPVPA